MVRLSHDFKRADLNFTYRLRLKSRFWVKIVYADFLDGADRWKNRVRPADFKIVR